MLHGIAADVLLIIHLAFILFVVLGGLLLFRWPRMAWFHLPAAVWGAVIEFNNWVCPLTPLEQKFRETSGGDAYSGGFVEHFLLPLVYPDDLTREIQIGLGLGVVLFNMLIYSLWWRKRKK